MNMAIIEVSTHLKGESSAQVAAGLRASASAQCFGRASAANSRAPQDPVAATPSEPFAPKGK